MLTSTHTKKKTKQSDILGRYYTQGDIGELLIDCMGKDLPNNVLDLGAGIGTLSQAAATRWKNSRIITVDIDPTASRLLEASFQINAPGRHSHILRDALHTDLPYYIRNELGVIDAAVCNPPFIKTKWEKNFSKILDEAGLTNCITISNTDIDASLLFLAQNLRTLDSQATLGIILPDTMTSSQRYRGFRKQLLKRYTIEAVIKLPRGSFIGTDALASIIVLRNSPKSNESVQLYKLTEERKLSAPMLVLAHRAEVRLDYDYHAVASLSSNQTKKTLAHICTDLRRGSIGNNTAKNSHIPVLHTTAMKAGDFGRWINLPEQGTPHGPSERYVIAQPGDILIARVGRNLSTKICGISTGSKILTDCIYRLRVPAPYRKPLLELLSSPRAREWFESRAYGVGARQLTKSDLLSFPISI